MTDLEAEFIKAPKHFSFGSPAAKAHHLGNYGEGAGHCDAPHPLQSWYGLPNTQLTSNGGARRVMLDWRPGQQISQTRLTVPIETVRMASLSSTYLDWIRNYTNSDDTLRLLVNNLSLIHI